MGSSMTSEGSKAWGADPAVLHERQGPRRARRSTGGQQPVSGDWWVWGNLPGQNPDGCLADDGRLRPEQAPFIAQMLPRR